MICDMISTDKISIGNAGFIGNKVFFYDKNTPIFSYHLPKRTIGSPNPMAFFIFPIFFRKESFYDT